MDASEYKNYVLNLLFLKYISDKARNDAKNNNFSEIEVPQGCFYEDILALEGDKEIGDKLNKIIAEIAEKNNLKGVIGLAPNLFWHFHSCMRDCFRQRKRARQKGRFYDRCEQGF